jgi:hypothetical protein
VAPLLAFQGDAQKIPLQTAVGKPGIKTKTKKHQKANVILFINFILPEIAANGFSRKIRHIDFEFSGSPFAGDRSCGHIRTVLGKGCPFAG